MRAVSTRSRPSSHSQGLGPAARGGATTGGVWMLLCPGACSPRPVQAVAVEEGVTQQRA